MHIRIFLVSKGEDFLHQMMLLLVMVKHIPIFNIFIPTFLHFVLQKLDQVASVEIIKGKTIIDVINLRQENEVKFWFIRSRPF